MRLTTCAIDGCRLQFIKPETWVWMRDACPNCRAKIRLKAGIEEVIEITPAGLIAILRAQEGERV